MEVGYDPDTGTHEGYTVHEVNHTVEFKALNEVTDVDVPARVVDWLEDRYAGDGGEAAEPDDGQEVDESEEGEVTA